MLLNFSNLSQRFENSTLGLLYPTPEGQRLIKAESLNFHQAKRIYPYEKMFLILTEKGELYYLTTVMNSLLSMLRELKGKKIIDVSVSYYLDSALILTDDGCVYAMGDNTNGQLGTGDNKEVFFPKQIMGLENLEPLMTEVTSILGKSIK